MHLTCTNSVDWLGCAELKLSSQGSFAVVWSDGGAVDGLIWWSGLTMVWRGIRMWWSDLGSNY